MITYFANPARFQKLARPMIFLATLIGLPLAAWGLFLGLLDSPPDYLQSETVRIMHIHVPAAWLSMMVYSSMAFAALIFLIWKHTLAGLYVRAVAPVGATFTAICLITGSIWGYPTWGTWWVWDARLTSVLLLFFLYVGVIALCYAFENKDKSLIAAAWLCLIGVVNMPIIKFSVDWWNTLHQPDSISSFAKMANPSVDSQMLKPLLIMAGAFLCLFIALAFIRLGNEIMARKVESAKLRGHYG